MVRTSWVNPLENLSLIRDWGTLDLFVLPGFSERTFPGRAGRLSSFPQVDSDQVSYESSSEQAHVDYAIRWSHVLDDWELGLLPLLWHRRRRTSDFQPVLIISGDRF